MAVITREREAETRPPEKRIERASHTDRWLYALAIVAVAAVAVVGIFLFTGETTTTVEPEFRSEQAVLADLANRGLIPNQAVDYQRLRTERLVNQGLIPAQALLPAPAPAPEPLLTAEEQLMMKLANEGLIPSQAVDWETINLKKLVNQGLIPRAALGD